MNGTIGHLTKAFRANGEFHQRGSSSLSFSPSSSICSSISSKDEEDDEDDYQVMG
jgi:hypothetical protein